MVPSAPLRISLPKEKHVGIPRLDWLAATEPRMLCLDRSGLTNRRRPSRLVGGREGPLSPPSGGDRRGHRSRPRSRSRRRGSAAAPGPGWEAWEGAALPRVRDERAKRDEGVFQMEVGGFERVGGVGRRRFRAVGGVRVLACFVVGSLLVWAAGGMGGIALRGKCGGVGTASAPCLLVGLGGCCARRAAVPSGPLGQVSGE